MIRTIICLVFVICLYPKYLFAEESPVHKLRVGFIGPFSGPAQIYGDAPRNGFEMALENIGRDWIEVYFEDDEFLPAKTALAFQKLVNVDRVDIVICIGSTPCNAVAPLAQSKKVPLFAWASDQKVSVGRPYVIRFYPSGTDEGEKAAKEAVSRGLNSLAVVVSIDDYSDSWRQGFLKSTPTSDIIFSEEVPKDSKDFRSTILKAISKKALQFAICLSPGQSAVFSKQLKEVAPKAEILGCETLNDQGEVKAAGGALDHAWFATVSITTEFREKYIKRIGNDSIISGAGIFYDLAPILKEAFLSKGATILPDGLISEAKRMGAVGTFQIRKKEEDRFFDIDLKIQNTKPVVK